MSFHKHKELLASVNNNYKCLYNFVFWCFIRRTNSNIMTLYILLISSTVRVLLRLTISVGTYSKIFEYVSQQTYSCTCDELGGIAIVVENVFQTPVKQLSFYFIFISSFELYVAYRIGCTRGYVHDLNIYIVYLLTL